VLGEFGDATDRYTTARSRKNYTATSPITRQSASESSCWPAMHPTTGSPMRCTSRRSAPCEHLQGQGPTTTHYALAVSAITRRCANSPTAWSASSTAA
jgi:hypothetical protein